MDNMRKLRKEKGISQQTIADAINISRVSISQYETGDREPSIDVLNKIADYLNVSVDQLLGRESLDSQAVNSTDITSKTDEAPVKRQTAMKSAASTVKVPLVGSFRCGFGRNGGEFLRYDELEVLPSFYERYGPDLVAYLAVGTSMMPTIHPGDLMYAVLGDAWEDDDIVALVIDDAETIKRIRRAPDGGVDIIPDNDSFRSIHLSPKDLRTRQLAVLARIVKIERDL